MTDEKERGGGAREAGRAARTSRRLEEAHSGDGPVTEVIRKLEAMIAQTVSDRAWFHNEALRSEPRNPGMMADAAGCAIREKALRDALAVVKGEIR